MKQSVIAAITAVAFMTGVGVATLSTASKAAVKPSTALRDACGADARKLCKSVVSNTAKRTACMKEHYAQLSDKCKEAIKAAKK
jgi:hypothetical protein